MQIWAHRGASGEFPENTLLAFEQAIIQKADGIELDVFQVEDELYIWHDRYISDASGQECLLAHQSKSWVAAIELPQSQHIPTLQEALETIDGRCAVNVEVKQLETPDLLVKTLDKAIAETSFEHQHFLISSFDHDFLDTWCSKELPYKVGLLSASTLRYVDVPKGLYSVNLCVNCLRKDDVQRAQDSGYKVLVYTVDKLTDIQLCRDLGVDGIFTNYPARSRKMVERL